MTRLTGRGWAALLSAGVVAGLLPVWDLVPWAVVR